MLYGLDSKGNLNLLIDWHEDSAPNSDLNLDIVLTIPGREPIIVPVNPGHQENDLFEMATGNVTEIYLKMNATEFNVAIRIAGKIFMRLPEIGSFITSKSIW